VQEAALRCLVKKCRRFLTLVIDGWAIILFRPCEGLLTTKGPLAPEVVAELHERFSSEDMPTAEELLKRTPLALIDSTASLEAARVHMAAIKVADGSLRTLQSALALASADWRDLLIQAGLSHNNWRDVLAREGFRVPQPAKRGPS
jgi:hypothetical protein